MATLTLKSGYNITLTEDSSAGTLTISATDTKYTIDSTLSSTSTNPIQNKVVYKALAGKQDKLTAGTGISISGNTISCTVSGGSGGGSITVDSTMSSTSTNPVQNKVIYSALQGKQNTLTAGTGISINGNTISCTVSGGGGTVTVDSALSGTSTNPVQNKVIYTALQNKQNKINYETWTFTTVSGTTVTKKVYIA